MYSMAMNDLIGIGILILLAFAGYQLEKTRNSVERIEDILDETSGRSARRESGDEEDLQS